MDELKVFSGNAHPALAKAITDYLGIPLGRCDVMQFSNENTFVKILENVRERDTFIVQPFSSPAGSCIGNVNGYIFINSTLYLVIVNTSDGKTYLRCFYWVYMYNRAIINWLLFEH